MNACAQQRGSVLWDGLGACVSLACAVHCALLPLAFAFLPGLHLALRSIQHEWHGLAMWLLWSHQIEQAVASVVVLFASIVLGLAWLRHRQWLPLKVAGAAAVLLLTGAFGHWHDGSNLHVALQVSGGLGIALAHVLNLRAERRSRCAASAWPQLMPDATSRPG